MSLPPGFLDELRSRTSLSQVAGRKLIWDMRKSNQARGDMWAPCPFHQEKTASFHVDDRKGFYYCFGCHAKGDAISFIRETENVDFMEAVRILAGEAGMQLPERDPQAQQKADRRTQLAEVMEMAVGHFRLQLKTGAAAEARAYLARRGLDAATQDRFEIGFAPDAWQGLWDHLTGRGVAPELIVACGLAKPSRNGGRPYDTFRGRIIFPIRDARGRCIAFGGRAMDPAESAKYLNSPETELFDKSRTLYNFAPAREAAGKGLPLILAEGYMDVIALVSAGFGASVAPLGTAVTETQLQLLWRMADEPVIALDGDKAGLGAVYRLVDLALPLLAAGKSLRFALLPRGQDPDDLLRAEGAGAVQALIDRALPMLRLLWQRETEARSFDSPERKAALERALDEKVALIRDPVIRGHYARELRDLRWRLFNPRREGPARTRRPGGQPAAALAPRASTRASFLAAAGEEAHTSLREAVVLAALLQCPALTEEFETALERLECRAPDHARLRDALLRHAADGPEALAAALGAGTLENLLARPHVALSPPARHPGDADLARMTVTAELARIEAERGLEHELSEAAEDMRGFADEALAWRLSQAAEARNRAALSRQEDRTEYDTGENGARIKRDERDAFEALLGRISYSKPDR